MKLPKGPKITMPKGPKLSLPSRGGAKKEPTAQAGMVGSAGSKHPSPQRVKPPGFVNDFYRDMRDRRLIIPALALLVAIAVVPVALSSDTEPVAPPAVAPLPDDVSAVQPAVVREQLAGVRSYRTRLNDFKRQNPFAQQFRIPEKSESDVAALSAPAEPTPGGDPGAVTPAPTTNTDIGGGVDTAPTPDPAPAPAPEPEILILAPRVDVKIGRIGEQKNVTDVEQGQVLPNRDAPVVMFLGATSDLKTASFLVSTDVTASAGDGLCSPSAQDCQFLKLKDGEDRSFDYGPDGLKYRLKVTDIREKIVDRRKGEES